MQRFQIELRRSNATHAFLNTSDLDTEGTYGCEVSTEVPSFRTIKAGKELRVHVIPKEGPRIYGVQKTYRIGDMVNMTCLFGPSKPPAHITWYINGEEAPTSYVFHSQPSSEEEDGLLISESRLNFALEPPRLWQGSLSVRCLASLSQVHATSSLELIVGEGTSGAEFQRILHVPPGQEGPVITGGLPRYYVGDIVDVNCSSARSLDLPRLEWHVNDEIVRAEFLTPYPPTRYPDGLSSTKLGLRFRVLPEHLRGDEIRLKCTATLSYVITRTSPETILMGDNHRSSSFHTSDRSGTAVTQVLSPSLYWLLILMCLIKRTVS
ncbi:ig-like domain-containing protein [Caerostris darwini]|uniref:Ig-like domain-containing protein n=1 Tax=Caerostris darwini TaxID=1538125 RepID=A0AAV4SY28_9ARAC|nr:ig-like domain-containing protein [Caerostris darwini]